jgi:CBS domain-containing protein
VHACRPKDSIESAERLMRSARVRRLPVVDRFGRLCGIVALGDLARHAAIAERGPRSPSAGTVALTLAIISSPRRLRAQARDGGLDLAATVKGRDAATST